MTPPFRLLVVSLTSLALRCRLGEEESIPLLLVKAVIQFLASENSLLDGRFAPDTVEKLCFKISGDFICDLSVILYSRYEEVVEVR